jgi:hypothetical protein
MIRDRSAIAPVQNGVFWFNTKRRTQTQVAEVGPNGRTYRRRVKTVDKPREEWVAVPVLDAGIPRELVDAARTRLGQNARVSSSGARFWELSGGLVRCGLCGRRMSPSTTVKGSKTYHYYRCDKRWQDGPGACPHDKHHRADKLEQLVRGFVLDSLTRPGPVPATARVAATISALKAEALAGAC